MASDTFIVRDRRPGYLRIYNDVYDRFGSVLGPYGLAVYVALCRYANQDSECWPSYSTIAKGTAMSRRQVIREIHKMETLLLIAVERRPDKTNIFYLLDTSGLEPVRGDTQSPEVVTVSHQVVTHSHPGGDSQSPEQELNNKAQTSRNNKKKENKTDGNPYVPAQFADVIVH